METLPHSTNAKQPSPGKSEDPPRALGLASGQSSPHTPLCGTLAPSSIKQTPLAHGQAHPEKPDTQAHQTSGFSKCYRFFGFLYRITYSS